MSNEYFENSFAKLNRNKSKIPFSEKTSTFSVVGFIGEGNLELGGVPSVRICRNATKSKRRIVKVSRNVRFITFKVDEVDQNLKKYLFFESFLPRCCEVFFDLLESIAENKKIRSIVWPLQILLLVLCPVSSL